MFVIQCIIMEIPRYSKEARGQTIANYYICTRYESLYCNCQLICSTSHYHNKMPNQAVLFNSKYNSETWKLKKNTPQHYINTISWKKYQVFEIRGIFFFVILTLLLYECGIYSNSYLIKLYNTTFYYISTIIML